MKKDKSMGMGKLFLVMTGSMMAVGAKYMMDHPEVKKNLKNTMKSACKKAYQMLDDMD